MQSASDEAMLSLLDKREKIHYIRNSYIDIDFVNCRKIRLH